MSPDVRNAYAAAASNIVGAFERAGGFPGQEVTPPLLVEALEQCIGIVAEPNAAARLSARELREFGTHALNCVSDLALWAAHLELDAERAAVEDLALEFARWLLAFDVSITVLEPEVNALARRANGTHDPEQLVPLAILARSLVAAAAPAARTDTSGSNAWQTLNFNYAIIATRTQRPELMEDAYDWLETTLPEQCAAFFEEGVRESRKAVYGPQVAEPLRKRLKKWTVRH